MMERISIQELAAVLTVKNGLKKKEAEQFASMIFEVVKDNLMSERLVKIKGLGTFKVIDIEPRESINVNTGERVLIEGHEKVTFTPDTAMKELVNRPFSQFETVILNDGVEFNVADAVQSDDDEDGESETMAPLAEEEEMTIVADEEPVVLSGEPVVLSEESVVSDEESEETVVSEEPMVDFVEEPVEETDAEPQIIPAVEDEDEAEVSVPDAEETVPVVEEEEIEVPVQDFMIDEPVETETLNDEDVTTASDEDVETPSDDEEEEIADDEEFEEETEGSSVSKMWIFLALAACALSFFVGYQFGKRNAEPVVDLTDSVQVLDKPAVTADTVNPAKVDTIKSEPVTPPATPAPKAQPVAPQVKENPQPAPAKAETTTPESPEVDYRKYEQMDARVRTGAYRIIGTAREVTAKEGETVKRIAQRILGPEMECYVEVYNGIKGDAPLTEGQTIKIPRLQFKKKKTQQTINQE